MTLGHFFLEQEYRIRHTRWAPFQTFHAAQGKARKVPALSLEQRCALHHGTMTGYQLGCRCHECRQANTDRVRRQRVADQKYRAQLGGLRASGLAIWAVVVALHGSGCAGSTGNPSASDPTERGLSYVAAAIVTSAVLRALCNK